MTQLDRPPKLYVTSGLLARAHDESITGVTAYNTVHEVIQRGSGGGLRGLSVSRLILHTTADIDDKGLRVYRVKPHDDDAVRLETANLPGIHPRDFIEDNLPEVHSLVVPVKEFDPTATAWALHNAAARYGEQLGLPGAGERELRAPTQGFGVPALDGALSTGLHFLGKMISDAQPRDRREDPEALSEQLAVGINSIIGRGVEAIHAVQGLPDISPLTAPEMAGLVAQNPPIVFHSK